MSNYILFIHFSHCSTPFLPLNSPPSSTFMLCFSLTFLPTSLWARILLCVPSRLALNSPLSAEGFLGTWHYRHGVSPIMCFFFLSFLFPFFFFLLELTQCCVMCKWKLWLSSPFLAALIGQAVSVASLIDTSKCVLIRFLFLLTFLNPAASNGKFQVLESNNPKFSWC